MAPRAKKKVGVRSPKKKNLIGLNNYKRLASLCLFLFLHAKKNTAARLPAGPSGLAEQHNSSACITLLTALVGMSASVALYFAFEYLH